MIEAFKNRKAYLIGFGKPATGLNKSQNLDHELQRVEKGLIEHLGFD